MEKARRRQNHLGFWLNKVGSPDLLILKSVPAGEWESWERAYIRNARMLGFDLVNGTTGGDGVGSGSSNPNFGKPRTDEVKRKISAAQMGKTITEEARGKMSAAKKGRKIPSEIREKMGAAGAGKKLQGSSSKFIGVYWDSFCKGWLAKLNIQKHSFNLGRYASEVEAAQVYDWAAALYGRPLNFPNEEK